METKREQLQTAEENEAQLANTIFEYIINGDPVPLDQVPPDYVGVLSQIRHSLSITDTPQPVVETARQMWQESAELATGKNLESMVQKRNQLGRWREISRVLSDLRLDRDQFAYNLALDANEY